MDAEEAGKYKNCNENKKNEVPCEQSGVPEVCQSDDKEMELDNKTRNETDSEPVGKNFPANVDEHSVHANQHENTSHLTESTETEEQESTAQVELTNKVENSPQRQILIQENKSEDEKEFLADQRAPSPNLDVTESHQVQQDQYLSMEQQVIQEETQQHVQCVETSEGVEQCDTQQDTSVLMHSEPEEEKRDEKDEEFADNTESKINLQQESETVSSRSEELEQPSVDDQKKPETENEITASNTLSAETGKDSTDQEGSDECSKSEPTTTELQPKEMIKVSNLSSDESSSARKQQDEYEKMDCSEENAEDLQNKDGIPKDIPVVDNISEIAEVGEDTCNKLSLTDSSEDTQANLVTKPSSTDDSTDKSGVSDTTERTPADITPNINTPCLNTEEMPGLEKAAHPDICTSDITSTDTASVKESTSRTERKEDLDTGDESVKLSALDKDDSSCRLHENLGSAVSCSGSETDNVKSYRKENLNILENPGNCDPVDSVQKIQTSDTLSVETKNLTSQISENIQSDAVSSIITETKSECAEKLDSIISETSEKIEVTESEKKECSPLSKEEVQATPQMTGEPLDDKEDNFTGVQDSQQFYAKSESIELNRSISSGFEVKIDDDTDKQNDVDSSSVQESSIYLNTPEINANQTVDTGSDKQVNNVAEQMDVDPATPSPYPESEMSETPGPGTPASTFSMADSASIAMSEIVEPPTPASSVTDNASAGPTPSKRARLGSNGSAATDSESHKFPASRLFEYQWPADGTGEYFMLQEQLSEFLGVKSFKRKYPDLVRRPVEIKERVFLLEKGAVSETQADLGLTALKSDEVCDLMHKDYPDNYQEYANVLHERQKQTISEKHKGYEVPKFEKSKMTQYIKKARKSASDWNSHILKERREERRAYLDLQTFNIHFPMGKFKKLPPEGTKINQYPVSLIPGQYQEYYKRYSADELKYFPLNTTLFNPPKRMGNALANPQEQPEMETASEEEENASGSESDSDDNNSSSGSDDSSGGEGSKEKQDEKGDEKETPATVVDICRICNVGKSSEVKGLEDLIQCSECKKLGHPGCLDLTVEMVSVIKTYPWQCMDCKTCVECMDPYDEDKMMFCDLCDRGYHTFCVGLKSIPNGRWKCRSCKGPDTPKTPRSVSKNRGKGRGRGRTPAQPAASEN